MSSGSDFQEDSSGTLQSEIRSTMFRVTLLEDRSWSRVVRASERPARYCASSMRTPCLARKLLALLKDPDLEFTQAKFYLPKEIQKRLKRRALELGVPTSSLLSAILAENT